MLSSATRTRVVTTLLGLVIATAAVVPGTSASQNVRAQDEPDASLNISFQDHRVGVVEQDLRSPDARDGGEQGSVTDLRSPDARDAAQDLGPALAHPLAESQATPRGFDWVSAAIGAAAGTGLLIVLLVSVGSSRLIGRRRATLGA